jgi:hypothetical protein
VVWLARLLGELL